MQNQLEISELKVGQDIGFVAIHVHDCYVGKSKVASVNRYGHIKLENGFVFDKNGRRKLEFSKRSSHYLISMEEYNIRTEQNNERIKRNNAKAEIRKILDNYNWVQRPIDGEDKQKLLNLVMQL